jgi:hypothetical protein
MKVKQLSVFLENQSGRLARVADALASEGINIRALSLADTSGFGILRLIVSDLPRARDVLQNKGLTIRETEVIAVEIPDRPGGLARVLNVLAANGINVEYMYAMPGRSAGNAIMVFRIEAADEAIAVLQANGVGVLSSEDVYTG